MRVLFFLLLLVNVVFYTYAFVARERSAPETAGAGLQIDPEKIRLVRHAEVPLATSLKSGAVAAAPVACVEWAMAAGPEAARADAALTRLSLRPDAVRRVTVDAAGYWVHIPSLKNKADVDKKLSEVKGLGFSDVSAVQDPGLGRNAVSLGVFSTEEAAQDRLAALKAKGVRSVVMERREGIIRQARFFLREPGHDTVAKLAELQQEFPASQIKVGPCPPLDAVAKD